MSHLINDNCSVYLQDGAGNFITVEINNPNHDNKPSLLKKVAVVIMENGVLHISDINNINHQSIFIKDSWRVNSYGDGFVGKKVNIGMV